MDIEINQREAVSFDQVKEGDLFLFAGDLYVRSYTFTFIGDGGSKLLGNAVKLREGSSAIFNEFHSVTLVKKITVDLL